MQSKEEHREKCRQWYYKNREAMKIKKKLQWAEIKNDIKTKEIVRKRNESIRSRFNASIQRAKYSQYEHTLTIDEYKIIVKDSICHYCGAPLDKTGSGLDRKDNTKGYNVDNCVACCGRCNHTFGSMYSYKAKLILAEAIKKIDLL